MLFWDVTQRRLVVTNRRFGTACQSHLEGACDARRKINIKGRGKEETERKGKKGKGRKRTQSEQQRVERQFNL